MLELRPTCENCNKALPPDSLEARICSYECTFCAACVDTVLDNVCPNCGGGFTPRPVRPSKNWKGDNYLGKDPRAPRSSTGRSTRLRTSGSLRPSRTSCLPGDRREVYVQRSYPGAVVPARKGLCTRSVMRP